MKSVEKLLLVLLLPLSMTLTGCSKEFWDGFAKGIEEGERNQRQAYIERNQTYYQTQNDSIRQGFPPTIGCETSVSMLGAGPQKFGNLIFKIPPGWTPGWSEDQMVLTPCNASPDGAAKIIIFPDQEVTADFRTWFDSTTQRMLGNRPVTWIEPTKRFAAVEDIEILRSVVRVETVEQFKGLGFIGVHSKDRGELIIMAFTSAAAQQRYTPDAEYFIRSVAFANQGLESQQAILDKEGPSKEPILEIDAGTHSATSYLSTDKAGAYLVSASIDKTVRLWSLRTGKILNVFRPPVTHGREGLIVSVAFSPDGRTIACGGFFGLAEGDQKPLYLFDRTTGKLSIPINDLLSWPVKLAFTHDGQYLVMALGIRQGLRIYRTTDWKMVLNDGDYGGLLQGLAVDRSSRIATVSEDGFIRLYEHFRLTKKEPLEGGKLPRNVSFSPSGQFLAVLFKDSSNVSVLSGSDLKPLYQATTPSGNLRFGSVAWSSDGQALFAAGEYVSDGKHQGAIRMWDQAGKGDATTVSVSDHPIADLVLLPDGRHAYSTESGEVGLVAPSTGKRTVLAQSANIEYSEAPRVSKDATVVQFGPGPHDAFDTKTRSFGSTTAVIPPITDAEKIKVTNWLNQKGTRINGKLLPISGSDFARSVAIAPSRDKVILGTTFQLLCFDPTGQVCWAHDVIGPARVNVASNQETVVASLGDGTIRWYRMTDGAELLVLFVHSDRKRWIMWTPSGYFDAAEGAEDLIGWHVNQGKDKAALFYPASHFFEQFYRPDLVAEVLKSVETDQQVLARLGEKERVTLQAGLKRPPTVTIVSPKPNAQFDLDEVEIQVQATDEGGGIDEIRLYHNGKVVGDQARGIKTMPSSVSASNSKVFRVLLVEGQNTVRAVAFSRDRIEGDPAEIQIRFKGLSTKATLHVLLVGINEYKNRALNLNYAVPDAKGMRDYFNGPRSGLFKEVKWHALYDKEATKPEILIKLQALQTSAPQDVVVIYLAGHGESIANTWYFVPHEVTTPEREDRLTQQGISSVELKALIERIGAQKVLVLLDACKSGAVMTAFGARGLEDRKALAQLARSTGVHVVAASTKDQFATEVTQLGHGVFTYTLLEGLNGKADGSPTDKSITVRELLSYVERQLPEVSEKYKTQAQYPVVDSRGMDFPIATMR